MNLRSPVCKRGRPPPHSYGASFGKKPEFITFDFEASRSRESDLGSLRLQVRLKPQGKAGPPRPCRPCAPFRTTSTRSPGERRLPQGAGADPGAAMATGRGLQALSPWQPAVIAPPRATAPGPPAGSARTLPRAPLPAGLPSGSLPEPSRPRGPGPHLGAQLAAPRSRACALADLPSRPDCSSQNAPRSSTRAASHPRPAPPPQFPLSPVSTVASVSTLLPL